MKTVSLKVPETLDRDLTELARQQGVSKSALIRGSLTDLVGEERPPARGSALALVEDLVGSLEGPGDLSFNPTHLDDFGR